MEEVKQEVGLTQEQIVRGFTNDATLATETFQLGDKEYPLVDLPYDDYIKFMLLMQPLVDVLKGKFMEKSGLSVPNIEIPSEALSIAGFVRYCGVSLPEMVRIMIKQTEPDITLAEVKARGKNPFNLAKIVLRQVIHNGMVKDFADFFALLIQLMKKGQASMTKATPQ